MLITTISPPSSMAENIEDQTYDSWTMIWIHSRPIGRLGFG